MPSSWYWRKAIVSSKRPIIGRIVKRDGRWVRAYRKPSAVNSPSVNLGEHDEFIRFRKESEQLRMEREILKKTAVFFAKETE